MLAELEDQQKLDKAILAAGNPRFKEELWINHRMLQLFGLLSLYFCCDGYGEDGFKEECLAPIPSGYTPDGSIELHITPNADGSVKMAPYPFDVVPLRVSVRARRMQPGRYASEAACRAAYFAGRYPSRVQPDDCLAGAGSRARGAEPRVRVKRRPQHLRRFELAIVVVARGRARACREQEIAAPRAAPPERGGGGDGARVVDHHRRREGLLAERKLAPVRVVAEADPVPGAGAQRLADARAARPGAVAQGGGEGALLVDLQGEARAGGGIDP